MIDIKGIDEVDRKIIRYLQDDPRIPHKKIGDLLNLSQPTIGTRIKKLRKDGVLDFYAGLSLKSLDLIVAKIDVLTTNTDSFIHSIMDNKHVINVLKIDGDYNLIIIAVCNSLIILDKLVNNLIRKNKDVKKVSYNIISSMLNNFVFPFFI